MTENIVMNPAHPRMVTAFGKTCEVANPYYSLNPLLRRERRKEGRMMWVGAVISTGFNLIIFYTGASAIYRSISIKEAAYQYIPLISCLRTNYPTQQTQT